MYDLIIIGGGPAGLTAALYARRAEKTVLVIEKAVFGGQITFSPKVENIPGFTAISGNEFADRFVEQTLAQDAEMEPAEVLEVRDMGNKKLVITEDDTFEAKAVIIAVGAKHRLLGLPGEEALIGNGISFCAVCDGAFYKGKNVGVVGGGNSALQEALLLADLAEKVTVIQNLSFLTGEEKLREQLRRKDNVTVLTDTVVAAVHGENELSGVTLKHGEQLSELALDGLFVAIGLIPQNEPFASLIKLNSYGYADADESCTTERPGIFVAGDCRSKKIRQVTTAAADGAIAALAACDYIDNLK